MWSLPGGVYGLATSSFSWAALGSLFMLGAIGTGIAFALYGVLLQRAGPVRGMIGIFFTPIIGTILGVTVRDDVLHGRRCRRDGGGDRRGDHDQPPRTVPGGPRWPAFSHHEAPVAGK